MSRLLQIVFLILFEGRRTSRRPWLD
jgi:hypothetical protein